LSGTIPYERDPHIEESFWDSIVDDLLPEDSEEKKILDQIFSKRRVLDSRKSMQKSGFIVLSAPERPVIIATHEKLKGYIIKAYLDSYSIDAGMKFKRRIDGARLIQRSIEAHGYEDLMKTPGKWLYALPVDSKSTDDAPRHYFIILCEKLDILNDEKNEIAYKKQMNKPLLEALFTILTENVLIDSTYIDNVPFCKDGRLAFIDTEHFNVTDRPLKLHHLQSKLSSKLQTYWMELIEGH